MTDARPHTDRTPWGAVLLLGALTAFGPMSIDMYLPSLPAIGAAFHARPGAAQATLASFFTGLAVGQIFYGPASDRWGRRWPLLGGVVLYVAASVWCALAPSLEILVAARFLQAIGGCAGQVIARAVVRDRFDHRQSARILSQLMLVMGIAPGGGRCSGSWPPSGRCSGFWSGSRSMRPARRKRRFRPSRNIRPAPT